MHRDIGEAAGEVAGCHDGAVTRHGAGDVAAAQMRQGVDDERAALGRRNRAGIGRETEGLDGVDVRDAGELVDLGDQEHRQQLMRDAVQSREAGHDLRHGHLVDQNELAVELFAVAVASVALGKNDKVLSDVAVDAVGKLVAHAQVGAAQAEDVLVHEAVAAEVRHHPAIVQRLVHSRDQVLGEGHEQHAPQTSPFIEVIDRVLDAAPLTTHGAHGAVAIQAAEVTLTVEDEVDLILHRGSRKGLVLFFDTVTVGNEDVLPALTELFPVGLLEHVPEDAADQFQVLCLSSPVHIVFRFEEFRIGIFHLAHYLAPLSLWIFLISRLSTNA